MRCSQAGEEAPFEQEDTRRAKDSETSHPAIAHDLQLTLPRGAPKETITGIHQPVEVQPTGEQYQAYHQQRGQSQGRQMRTSDYYEER